MVLRLFGKKPKKKKMNRAARCFPVSGERVHVRAFGVSLGLSTRVLSEFRDTAEGESARRRLKSENVASLSVAGARLMSGKRIEGIALFSTTLFVRPTMSLSRG